MKYLILEHSNNRLNFFASQLLLFGNVVVMQIGKQQQHINDLNFDLLIEKVQDYKPDYVITDEKSEIYDVISKSYFSQKIVCFFSKSTFKAFVEVTYENEKVLTSNVLYIDILSKIKGAKPGKNLLFTPLLGGVVSKDIDVGYLISQPSVFKKLLLNNSYDDVKTITAQCFMEYAITEHFAERRLSSLISDSTQRNEIIEEVKKFFFNVLIFFDFIQESKFKIVPIIPKIIQIPEHLKVYKYCEVIYYDSEQELYNVYNRIKYIVLSKSVDAQYAYYETPIFDIYERGALPIVHEETIEAFLPYVSNAINLQTYSTLSDLDRSIDSWDQKSQQLRAHIALQKDYIRQYSQVFSEAVSSTMVEVVQSEPLQTISETQIWSLATFNRFKRICIIQDDDFEQSFALKSIKMSLEAFGLEKEFMIETLNSSEIDSQLSILLSRVEPTHLIVLSPVHYDFDALRDEYEFELIEFIDNAESFTASDRTYLAVSADIYLTGRERGFEVIFHPIPLTYLPHFGTAHKSVGISNDFENIEEELNDFFSSNEHNRLVLDEFFSVLNTSFSLRAVKKNCPQFWQYCENYYHNEIPKIEHFVVSVKYNYFLMQCANTIVKVPHSGISGSLDWINTVVDNIDIVAKYEGIIERKLAKLIQKASEYKVFVYIQPLESESEWEAVSLVASLKNTLVLLPKSLERAFVLRFGDNQFVFYSIDNLHDVIEQYLNDENLRSSAIQKSLKCIDAKIENDVWQRCFKE